MQGTPRVDAEIDRLQTPAGGLIEGAEAALIDLARQLERELAGARAQLGRMSNLVTPDESMRDQLVWWLEHFARTLAAHESQRCRGFAEWVRNIQRAPSGRSLTHIGNEPTQSGHAVPGEGLVKGDK